MVCDERKRTYAYFSFNHNQSLLKNLMNYFYEAIDFFLGKVNHFNKNQKISFYICMKLINLISD